MIPPLNRTPVKIESFEIRGAAGERAKVSLRPLRGQKFAASLIVEGNKSLIEDYPIGTRFRVQAALMRRPSGAQYLFTSWQWDVQTLSGVSNCQTS
jgi:hypothetical protein